MWLTMLNNRVLRSAIEEILNISSKRLLEESEVELTGHGLELKSVGVLHTENNVGTTITLLHNSTLTFIGGLSSNVTIQSKNIFFSVREKHKFKLSLNSDNIDGLDILLTEYKRTNSLRNIIHFIILNDLDAVAWSLRNNYYNDSSSQFALSLDIVSLYAKYVLGNKQSFSQEEIDEAYDIIENTTKVDISEIEHRICKNYALVKQVLTPYSQIKECPDIGKWLFNIIDWLLLTRTNFKILKSFFEKHLENTLKSLRVDSFLIPKRKNKYSSQLMLSLEDLLSEERLATLKEDNKEYLLNHLWYVVASSFFELSTANGASPDIKATLKVEQQGRLINIQNDYTYIKEWTYYKNNTKLHVHYCKTIRFTENKLSIHLEILSPGDDISVVNDEALVVYDLGRRAPLCHPLIKNCTEAEEKMIYIYLDDYKHILKDLIALLKRGNNNV